MLKKKWFVLIILIIPIVVGASMLGSMFGEDTVEYQFTEISRGNIENTISSSGSLTPVTTVDIGTQVSGTIAKVYVDFNDIVRKGQLLAVLDTALLKAAVLDAQAGLEVAEAQLEEALLNYNSSQPLYERKLISETEYIPIKLNVDIKRAALKSAQAGLERAQQNLDYAVIRSPINGIVIAKDVEEGQTVAASFSTPTLFQIAENLEQMEIMAEVDESDIGLIRVGQPVRFEVQAYSDKTFEGTVKQIRLQPQTVSNVVNYTVVVSAENADNLLLPGMTATVDFIIQQINDVLIVSKSALRYMPSEKEIQQARQRMHQKMMASREQTRQIDQGKGFEPEEGLKGSGDDGLPEDMAFLWYLDDNGSLAMEPVQTGASDDTNIEILRSRSLTEGKKVISGSGTSNSQSRSSSSDMRGMGRALSGGPPRGGPPPP